MNLVRYAFSLLPPDGWLAPRDLEPTLAQHYHEALVEREQHRRYAPGLEKDAAPPTAAAICAAGFALGFLDRQGSTNPQYRQRCAPSYPPEQFLAPEAAGSVAVDLERIPLETLEELSAVARFCVAGGNLWAAPDPIRLGRATRGESAPAVLEWLSRQSAPWEQAWQRMRSIAGRQIVHDNLVFARIRDLAVRVQVERTVNGGADPPRVVTLGGEFLAFPRALLGDVEKAARRAGLAVRTVEAKTTPKGQRAAAASAEVEATR